MVTTRRGTETPGQDSSATPRSSVKRKVGKRELEALDTPTAVKRQKKITPKKAAVETVDELALEDATAPESAEDTSDTIDVAIPRGETPPQVGKLAIRRRSSPKVVVTKLSQHGAEEALTEDELTPTQEAVYQTPDQQSSSVYTTPATRKKGEASPTPRAKRANERTSSVKKSGGRDTKVEDATPTAPSKQAPNPSQDVPEVPSQTKKAHMRFGSEEPSEKVTMNLQGHKRYDAPAKAQIADSEDDDSASDSDEAPEVVTTQTAASRAAASAHDAARAQLAAQAKEDAKHAARTARIAAEQAEKRKREDQKAQKLARKLAKQQQDAQPPSTESTSNTSIDLAGLLPTSLLTSLPDRRAPTPPPARYGKTEEQLRQEKLNHHIKFLERTDKGIKEVKKGKLSVAVLGKQNLGVLPPKVNRDTRDVREKWLKGREGKRVKGAKGIGGKMERRKFGGGGFLRGED